LKICKICNKMLPLSNFRIIKHRKINSTFCNTLCKICEKKINNEYQKSYKKGIKRKLVEYMGGCCKICGFNDYISALEFHHLNPEHKEFTISKYYNLEEAKKELSKCLLVCANCHRGIHNNEIKSLKSNNIEITC